MSSYNYRALNLFDEVWCVVAPGPRLIQPLSREEAVCVRETLSAVAHFFARRNHRGPSGKVSCKLILDFDAGTASVDEERVEETPTVPAGQVSEPDHEERGVQKAPLTGPINGTKHPALPCFFCSVERRPGDRCWLVEGNCVNQPPDGCIVLDLEHPIPERSE